MFCKSVESTNELVIGMIHFHYYILFIVSNLTDFYSFYLYDDKNRDSVTY